jgi:hypothetical protein
MDFIKRAKLTKCPRPCQAAFAEDSPVGIPMIPPFSLSFLPPAFKPKLKGFDPDRRQSFIPTGLLDFHFQSSRKKNFNL